MRLRGVSARNAERSKVCPRKAFRMRRLNIRLLAWLVGIVVPGAVGVHLLHGFQVARKADTLVTRAREKRAAGETDEAVKLLGRYVGLRPDDAAASAELATTLLTHLEAVPPTRRDVARAFAALETAVRDNPADGPLRLKLAEFCVRLGRHADAQQHLTRLAAARTARHDGPVNDAAVELLRGQAAIGAGDVPEAVRILGALVGFDPDSHKFISSAGPADAETATALTLLAAIFDTRLDDPATAAVVMRRLEQARPDDPRVWATLARWHLAHDDPEAAAAAAARSRTLAADDPETALISFEVALATDDLAAAEQAITGRLVAHPDDERMHRAAALLATRRGRLEEAVAAIRDGLAHQPESSPLQATLAELLLLQGSIADAREVIDTLAAVEGDDAPRVALLEGWCLVEERQWPRAKQVLQRLRPQMATDDRLRGQIDLLLARCHGSLGAFDEQLTICENLLADTPELTAARRTAAAALLALGRPAEALQLLDNEPGIGVTEPATLRAECLLALGQAEAAIDLLTRAAERQPADPRGQAMRVEAIFRQRGPAAARKTLGNLPAMLAETPPLLATRGLLTASLPPEEATRELAAIEAAATSLPDDERRSVLTALARLQGGLGNRAAAQRLWERVLDVQPDDLAAAWELYDLAASSGGTEAICESLETIERIAGVASASGRAARAGSLILHVAATMPERDDALLDEARHLLIEAEAERPQWQRVQLFLAEAERLRGNRVAERERLQQAIDCGPRHSAIVRRLISLLVIDHRFDAAARLALPSAAEVIFTSELLGRRPEPAAWRAAVGLLESLASSQPLATAQRVRLADLRDRLGLWSECRADLQSLAAATDAAPTITALLVGKLIDHEEFAAARSWLTKLQRTSPGTVGLLMLEARLAAASDDLEAAESFYRAVLADEEADEATRAVAANNLAFQLATPATADEAAALIDTAINVLGPRPDLLDTRGLVRLAQGNVAAAVSDLEEACLVPSLAKLAHLAKAHAARGDTARAAATLARAHRLMEASPHLSDRDRSLLDEVEQEVSPALQRP
jgi:cellulose synthase operon protein C